MKKVVCMVLAAVMLMACLAGCGSTAAETPSSGDNSSTASASAFKIGGTAPLTGGAAIYGNAVKNAAQIAVDEINAKGGIQFELRYEDDQNDTEKAVNAYNTLKDWGMQISLGSVTSKPCEVTSGETFVDRIFALTPSASSVATTDGKDNQFQMCFTDPNQGSASAQYIADKALASKVAVIWKNDDVYSKGIYETFKAACDKLNIEIVSDTTFADGNDTDFSVQIADAQTNGAELVFLPIYYQPASLILAQAAAAGYEPKWFGVDGMDGILTMKGFDTSLAEGVMLLTPFSADAEDELTKNYVAAYQAKHGEIPNQFAADAYDGIYALKAAVELAGVTAETAPEDACDPMIAAMQQIEINGLTGTMRWDATGEVDKTPTAVVIEDGVYVGAK